MQSEAEGLPVHAVRYGGLLKNPFNEVRQCVQYVSGLTCFSDESIKNAVDLNDFKFITRERRAGCQAINHSCAKV